MKKLIYILALFVAILSVGCVEDKGHYDYTKINEITISNIDKSYSLIDGSDFVIEPYLDFLQDSLEDGLKYRWTINGEEVATTRNLNYTIPTTLGFGKKDCRYEIVDHKNGMKYFQSFELEITSFFSWGYYFLTKRADNSTELGYFSVRKENQEFAYTSEIGDYQFGNDPQVIKGNWGNVKLNGATTYCFYFTVITKEGEYPVINSETATFYPRSLITEAHFFDKEAGYKFDPIDKVHMTSNDNDFYFSNGQVIGFVERMLYRPAIHSGGSYYWTHPIGNSSGEKNCFAFDEISKKYYYLRCERDDIIQGILGDSYALDKVVEIENFPSLEGHTILVASEGPWAWPVKPGIITYDNGTTHFVNFTVNPDNPWYYPTDDAKVTSHQTLTMSYLNEKSIGVGTEFDWFVSGEGGIYRAPKENVSEIKEFTKIPEEFGTVTSMQLSVNATKIVVSTYNPASSSERKGSVLFIDSTSGEIVDSYQNVIHECVSILSANTFSGYGKVE